MSSGFGRVHMIRTGFMLPHTNDWLGGVNYLRNLIGAITKLDNPKIEPILITGTPNKINNEILKEFPPVEVLHSSLFDPVTPLWFIRKIIKRLFDRDPLVYNFFKKHNIHILSHNGYFRNNEDILTIGWIPDFQHRCFPEFFTKKEIFARNKTLLRLCKHCDSIVLSSFDAQEELFRFAPSFSDKSSVLRFVGGPIKNLRLPKLEELIERYRFKTPYFYVPNQFWAHKNHKIIVKALKALKTRGKEISVLASGATRDYRQPNHFKSLINLANESGVISNFQVLGIIPYSDVLGLMRYSKAIINPSFYEGWSTTIEEAKTLGSRVILSDIPVHREQSPPSGIFFDPANHNDLANTMLAILKENNADPPAFLTKKEQDDLVKRLKSFAYDYEKIILDLLARR